MIVVGIVAAVALAARWARPSLTDTDAPHGLRSAEAVCGGAAAVEQYFGR
jgi:hypothetical protein